MRQFSSRVSGRDSADYKFVQLVQTDPRIVAAIHAPTSKDWVEITSVIFADSECKLSNSSKPIPHQTLASSVNVYGDPSE